MLAKLNYPVEALKAHERALAVDPDFYESVVGAGRLRLTIGFDTQSRDLYLRAAALNPLDGEPLSALAVIAARLGDVAGPVLRRKGAHPTTGLCQKRTSPSPAPTWPKMHLAAALDRLRPLLSRPDLDDEHRADVMSYVADALDLLDRPDEAFPFYRQRNALLDAARRTRARGGSGESIVDQARRLTAYFIAAPSEPWRAAPGQDRRGAQTVGGHLFLLGFPRSGTTLLEKVLASHLRIVALEEREALIQAGGHFFTSDIALDRLATLTQAGADACRAVYWDRVQAMMSADLPTKVFIDKLPLHSMKLPIIAKLFPAARIIMAVRDPRDVVLSCFRRRFLINAAMAELLTLEGAAGFYDEVMRLVEVCRAKLPLRIETVRHEDLVADFDGEAGRLVAYCGVEWDPAVRDFAARATGNRTPSAVQVRRGLNSEGVGQWRRYRQAMAPVLPLLAHWAGKFGYPID